MTSVNQKNASLLQQETLTSSDDETNLATSITSLNSDD